MKGTTLQHVFLLLVLGSLAISIKAQTTTFTYQGKLNDTGAPATGTYLMEFKLYDLPSTGNQIGSTISNPNVVVTNGIFTVNLDFGSSPFAGADRYLQIGVKRIASDPFTILSPRQQIASSPYAIQTLKAQQANIALDSQKLGGVNATEYVQTTDPRMTDARNPLPGSSFYIRNTTAQQASSDFNISGNGNANFFNATTQYNIGGNRVLSIAGTRNAFGGVGAGQSNVQGMDNAFFGFNAGLSNVGNDSGIAGNSNSYVGSRAGENNALGRFNSFFGASAGQQSTGNNNSIFGATAGIGTTTGSDNSMFGLSAGENATTGSENSFFGLQAGAGILPFGEPPTPNTASGNSYFGTRAGLRTTTGNNNSFFGTNAGQENRAANNNSFFGASAGRNNITGQRNAFFGADAGQNNLASFNTFVGSFAGQLTTSGFSNTFVGYGAGFGNMTGSNNTVIGVLADVSGNSVFETVIGAGAMGSGSHSITLGTTPDWVIVPGRIGIGTTVPVHGLTVSSGPPWTNDAWIGSIALPNASAIGWHANSANQLFGIGQTNWGLSFFGTSSPLGAQAGPPFYIMNLDNDGRVSIGTTIADQRLSVNGDASKTGGGSWLAYSDERLKKLGGRFRTGLKAILQLQPVRYSYKQDNALHLDPNGVHVGFSAQAVSKIVPEAVSTNDKGYLLLNNDPILWAMLNAIKEQQAQIKAQQNQINALKKLVRAHKFASKSGQTNHRTKKL
ncbi:MAG TPA: tail fiber domain-containing protein [Pyrinomonadaceae bacterium]